MTDPARRRDLGGMDRRTFLGSATGAAAFATAPAVAADIADIPIIDCHIHLFDGRRPQGAPYKGGRAFPGGVALPDMYAEIARPLGIVELPDTVALMREYFAPRGRAAAQKVFWKNSIAAYKWVHRASDQPSLS